jgi:CRP-like cAMP-binding protein
VDESSRVRLLTRCPLFADVPEPDLVRLATAAGLRRFRRGQLLFAEGDDGDSLLVVAEGSLKAVSTSPDGEEFLLAVVERYEAVGELTVADGGVRSASVTALTDTAVLRLPREAVLAVARTSPPVAMALLAALAAVVRRLTGAAADLVFLDIPRRVAKFVLAQGAGGPVVRTRLTQAEMADRVGASRQSVNAALQDFQRRGWITVGSREITLHDPAALRRFVGV